MFRMTSDAKPSRAVGNVTALIDQIDARLAVLVPQAIDGQSGLDSAIRTSVLAPGKRLRPLMTVLAAQDLGGDVATAIDAGCAVELVHASSLILDDLPSMDDAVMRRGQPALHVSHGEDVALLSSIAILTGAIEMLASIEALPPLARLQAVTTLTRSIGVEGLVGGQYADLNDGRASRPVHEIAVTNSLKTGSLFSAAVEIGAIVANADMGTRTELRAFACELGHAFQLLDDLLDSGASPVAIGKDVGKDVGKSTIVSMLGRPSVERRIEGHVASAHESLSAVFGAKSRLHHLTDAIFEKAMRARVEKSAKSAEGGAEPRREQEAGAR